MLFSPCKISGVNSPRFDAHIRRSSSFAISTSGATGTVYMFRRVYSRRGRPWRIGTCGTIPLTDFDGPRGLSAFRSSRQKTDGRVAQTRLETGAAARRRHHHTFHFPENFGDSSKERGKEAGGAEKTSKSCWEVKRPNTDVRVIKNNFPAFLTLVVVVVSTEQLMDVVVGVSTTSWQRTAAPPTNHFRLQFFNNQLIANGKRQTVWN